MSVINSGGLDLECMRVFHETFLMPVFLQGSNTMILKRKRGLCKQNLRGLLSILRIDKVANMQIKVRRKVNERIWKVFSNCSAIFKEWGMIGLVKGYMRVVSCLVCQMQKREINSVNDSIRMFEY